MCCLIYETSKKFNNRLTASSLESSELGGRPDSLTSHLSGMDMAFEGEVISERMAADSILCSASTRVKRASKFCISVRISFRNSLIEFKIVTVSVFCFAYKSLKLIAGVLFAMVGEVGSSNQSGVVEGVCLGSLAM